MRRWVIRSQVDGGQRQGATTKELAEIKALMAANRRLREDVEILRGATSSSGTRTYRNWKQAGRVIGAQTVTDVQVVDAVRDIAGTTDAQVGASLTRGSLRAAEDDRQPAAHRDA